MADIAQTIATINNTGNGNFPGDNGFFYKGGEQHFAFYGDFTGSGANSKATVTIKASFEGDLDATPKQLPASSTFINLTDEAGSPVSISAPEVIKINIGKCHLQFVVTDANGSTDITVKAS